MVSVKNAPIGKVGLVHTGVAIESLISGMFILDCSATTTTPTTLKTTIKIFLDLQH
jgi:hypothetical protein